MPRSDSESDSEYESDSESDSESEGDIPDNLIKTHDNGGEPFGVEITGKRFRLTIWKRVVHRNFHSRQENFPR